MPRAAPSARLEQLIESAARVFAEKGYARAQMSDIARLMGVSQGALYNYVESKEALFALLINPALAQRAADGQPRLPVPTPSPGATVNALRRELAKRTELPRLARALEAERREDPGTELAEVVEELYGVVAESWSTAAAIERSALDEPELARAYFLEARRSVIDRMTAYLEARIAGGEFRAVPDPATAARLIIESVTWFARHRHGDPDSGTIDDQRGCATVVDFVVGSLVPR